MKVYHFNTFKKNYGIHGPFKRYHQERVLNNLGFDYVGTVSPESVPWVERDHCWRWAMVCDFITKKRPKESYANEDWIGVYFSRMCPAYGLTDSGDIDISKSFGSSEVAYVYIGKKSDVKQKLLIGLIKEATEK